MRHYGIEMTATPPVCVESGLHVCAFRSVAERDAWVSERPTDDVSYRIAGTWLRVGRQTVSASVAARVMSGIMRGAYGGRQNGRAALAEVAPE